MPSEIATPDTGPTIACHGVSKCYKLYPRPIDRLVESMPFVRTPRHREIWAVRDANLELHPGEAVGVIGRNGSGKSTLLQMIAGTLSPTTGSVAVRGRIAALLELGSGFNPEFTGRENVYMNAAILGLSRREVQDRFDGIADFAGLGDFIEQPVKTYSSGMVVRLAFAVQVQLDPDVLIVDEALAVGDAAFQRKCFRRLESLRERGVSILFVSHATDAVRSLCDHALYLEHGRAKMSGPSKEVCDAYLEDILADQFAESGGGASGRSSVAGALSSEAGEAVRGRVLDAFEWAGPGSPPPPKGTVQAGETVMIRRATLATESHSLVVCEDDAVSVCIELVANGSVNPMLIGILLRDKLGSDVFGVSIRPEDSGLPATLGAGETIALTFHLTCQLRADTYFITLGMREDETDDVLFYGHDILELKVNPTPGHDPRLIGGLCRLPLKVEAHGVSESVLTGDPSL